MRYVLIVSHGMFANGIHDAVKMLSGNESDEIRSIGLLRDMGADEFAVEFRKILPELGPEDEIIMFADIVGGSPLSTAANVIAEEGLLDKTLMIGGMNLPLVLTGVLSKDDMTFDEIKTELLEDAAAGVKVFSVETEAGADDDI
ncbi:MAG TPA: PTS fructose transporter subunit IIA [Lachnospiraceae bacterium]|nr:PTS fructose transporter subunit IIA [Lachnospiraceae bacterium]